MKGVARPAEQDALMTRMLNSGLRLVVFTAQVPWGKGESFVLTEIVELRRHVEAILVIPAKPESVLFHKELASLVGQYAIRLPVLSPMIRSEERRVGKE